MQYEPTPLTEKKIDGFMAYLTNEPFIVQSKGFTPVTLSFADNGLPLASETFVVTTETLESDRDKLKAFLTAEIKGWNDAVADPAAGAALAADTYGKGLGLDVKGQTEQLEAQLKLIVSDDTKANGLFTLTDDFQAKIVAAIGALGTQITAADLFDMSLLSEIYAADPSLSSRADRDVAGPGAGCRGGHTLPGALRHACSPPVTRPPRPQAATGLNLQGLSKTFTLGRNQVQRAGADRPRDRAGDVPVAARAVGLRQVDGPAHPRRAGGADVGHGADQRDVDRGDPARAPPGHRLPGRGAAALADGRRATSGCRSRWPASGPSPG